jgi:hypothetical protein
MDVRALNCAQGFFFPVQPRTQSMPRALLIDTDAGVDDAQAIIFCLGRPGLRAQILVVSNTQSLMSRPLRASTATRVSRMSS